MNSRTKSPTSEMMVYLFTVPTFAIQLIDIERPRVKSAPRKRRWKWVKNVGSAKLNSHALNAPVRRFFKRQLHMSGVKKLSNERHKTRRMHRALLPRIVPFPLSRTLYATTEVELGQPPMHECKFLLGALFARCTILHRFIPRKGAYASRRVRGCSGLAATR